MPRTPYQCVRISRNSWKINGILSATVGSLALVNLGNLVIIVSGSGGGVVGGRGVGGASI